MFHHIRQRQDGEVKVSKASEADIPCIYNLIVKLAQFEGKTANDIGVTEASLKEFGFGVKKCFDVQLAREGEEVVGYALYSTRFSGWKGKPVLYIEDLFVLPEFRGKGFGRALLSSLTLEAQKLQCGFLEWLVFDWNESALKFYQKIGAEVRNDFKVLRLDPNAVSST